jgi:hypothetical protein
MQVKLGEGGCLVLFERYYLYTRMRLAQSEYTLFASSSPAAAVMTNWVGQSKNLGSRTETITVDLELSLVEADSALR